MTLMKQNFTPVKKSSGIKYFYIGFLILLAMALPSACGRQPYYDNVDSAVAQYGPPISDRIRWTEIPGGKMGYWEWENGYWLEISILENGKVFIDEGELN